jgi:hypothetical protein
VTSDQSDCRGYGWRERRPSRRGVVDGREPRLWLLAQTLAQWRTLGQHYNGSDMPAGEAQRVWFPEMIEWLRSEWHPGMSLDAIIELRDGLDPMLQRIPSERHIRPPIFRCTQSGHVGEGTEPHISVRAMILSLSRFGIATAELTHALEKDWAAYRQGNGLDLYGRSLASLPTEASCLHPQVR